MMTVRPAPEMDSELNMNVLQSNKDTSSITCLDFKLLFGDIRFYMGPT